MIGALWTTVVSFLVQLNVLALASTALTVSYGGASVWTAVAVWLGETTVRAGGQAFSKASMVGKLGVACYRRWETQVALRPSVMLVPWVTQNRDKSSRSIA